MKEKMAEHIKTFQKHGHVPTRNSVRSIAFHLAERLNLDHIFDRENQMAGYDWLKSFLSRNPDLTVRKAEGVSVTHSSKEYFDLLKELLSENHLIRKPGHIFSMDETGLPLNNKPGEVIAEKGSRSVSLITSGEKGETISVLACANGEGSFIPPYYIFKGENSKNEYTYGMPPGSVAKMSHKSEYVNSDISFGWLRNYFTPRNHKEIEQWNNFAEFPKQRNSLAPTTRQGIFQVPVVLLLLRHATTLWQTTLQENLQDYSSEIMLIAAWNKSESVENGIKSTGIIPFNPNVIPEYGFLTNITGQNQASDAIQ
ncbi:hypothetical protein PR048_010986 [Dryococelus australis]|uniref:HTH CENPB-type domain-containing protein n=1 Tax=Dryococelus australis TaxID=614101 RepID=A0ABQ9HKA9_9NEOP|nr:hypothetical protein PR048_010986 [Dryococelus australis]